MENIISQISRVKLQTVWTDWIEKEGFTFSPKARILCKIVKSLVCFGLLLICPHCCIYQSTFDACRYCNDSLRSMWVFANSWTIPLDMQGYSRWKTWLVKSIKSMNSWFFNDWWFSDILDSLLLVNIFFNAWGRSLCEKIFCFSALTFKNFVISSTIMTPWMSILMSGLSTCNNDLQEYWHCSLHCFPPLDVREHFGWRNFW